MTKVDRRDNTTPGGIRLDGGSVRGVRAGQGHETNPGAWPRAPLGNLPARLVGTDDTRRGVRHAEGIRQKAPPIRYHMERRRVVERAAEREQCASRIDIKFEKHVEETVRGLRVQDVLGHQPEGWEHNPGAGANAKGFRQDSGAGG